MSTKIGAGFRFASRDLGEVTALVQDFKDRLGPLHEAALHRLFVGKAVGAYDRESARMKDGGEPSGNFLAPAVDDVEKRQKRISTDRTRDPEVDFEFIVRLYVDPQDGAFLGLVGTEVGDWFRLWMDQPGIRDWSYWDSTDSRPDGVSSEEWNQRRESWDRVIRPRVSGRSIHWSCDLTDPHLLFHCKQITPEELRAALPPFEKRVEAIARSLAFRRWNEANPGPDPASNPSITRIMEWMGGFDDHLAAPEGRRAMSAARKEAVGLLVPEPTIAMLLGHEPWWVKPGEGGDSPSAPSP